MNRRIQGTLAVGALAGATAALLLASPAGAGVERATATAKNSGTARRSSGCIRMVWGASARETRRAAGR